MILAPAAAAIAVFQPSAGTNAIAGPIFMYAAIIGIFYFILIRPQQQQRKKLESMIKTLKKGDRVVTAGGLVGDVVHIRESVTEGTTTATLDDEVTLKSGDSRVIVERRGIARVVKSAGAAAPAAT
jgi:preprotein translocase subunit YajC